MNLNTSISIKCKIQKITSHNNMDKLIPKEKKLFLYLIMFSIINGLIQTGSLMILLPFIQSILNANLLLSTEPLKYLIKSGIDLNSQNIVIVLSVALLISILIKNLSHIFLAYYDSQFTAVAEARMAKNLLKGYVFTKYSWIVQQNQSIIRDTILINVVNWSRNYLRCILLAINELFFIIIASAFLLYLNVTVGIFLFIIIFLLVKIIMKFSRKKLNIIASEKQSAMYKMGISCNEILEGARDIKILNVDEYLIKKFDSYFSKYSHNDKLNQIFSSIPRLTLEVIGYLCLIGSVIYVQYYSADGASNNVAKIAVYGIAALKILPTLNALLTYIHKIMDSIPSIIEVNNLLVNVTNLREIGIQDSICSNNIWNKISFDNITYHHSGRDLIALNNISLCISRGEKIGLVGESGSGKSTLADIVAGLIFPDLGDVSIDNIKISNAQMLAWRARIGYVSQRSFLFDATLAENICVDPGKFDLSEINTVIRAVGLLDLVDKMPLGLNTPIGDKGVMVSGGQKQKIVLARALYTKPEFLILDEATSALDLSSELEIQNALDELSKTITTLTIAHKLSAVINCDRILLLDKGKIIEQGTHKDLIIKSGFYRDLFKV